MNYVREVCAADKFTVNAISVSNLSRGMMQRGRYERLVGQQWMESRSTLTMDIAMYKAPVGCANEG